MKKELKKILDELYEVGYRNGGIEMKNKILKKLNRDQKLWIGKDMTTRMELMVKVLKTIEKI